MCWALWLQRRAGPLWKEGVRPASLGSAGELRDPPALTRTRVAWLRARPSSVAHGRLPCQDGDRDLAFVVGRKV